MFIVREQIPVVGFGLFSWTHRSEQILKTWFLIEELLFTTFRRSSFGLELGFLTLDIIHPLESWDSWIRPTLDRCQLIGFLFKLMRNWIDMIKMFIFIIMVFWFFTLGIIIGFSSIILRHLVNGVVLGSERFHITHINGFIIDSMSLRRNLISVSISFRFTLTGFQRWLILGDFFRWGFNVTRCVWRYIIRDITERDIFKLETFQEEPFIIKDQILSFYLVSESQLPQSLCLYKLGVGFYDLVRNDNAQVDYNLEDNKTYDYPTYLMNQLNENKVP